MRKDINTIPAEVRVCVELYFNLEGEVISTNGIGEKRFNTLEEAEAFVLGIQYLQERLAEDVTIGDPVEYKGQWAVRVVVGEQDDDEDNIFWFNPDNLPDDWDEYASAYDFEANERYEPSDI